MKILRKSHSARRKIRSFRQIQSTMAEENLTEFYSNDELRNLEISIVTNASKPVLSAEIETNQPGKVSEF